MKLDEYLYKKAPFPFAIVWHQNRTVFLSLQQNGLLLTVRLHRLFEAQPMPVWEALSRYILRRDPKAKAILREAVRSHFSFAWQAPARLPSKGAVHDLALAYEAVKNRYFPSFDEDLTIGWSKAAPRAIGRCMTLGSYDAGARQIRIHPQLDHPLVPCYFLEFVIYHEILHAVHPPVLTKGGRLSVHTTEFRKAERLFDLYQEAKAFEKKLLQVRHYGRA